MNILNKKFWFSMFNNFKLLSQMQGKSTNSCDFFKFLISVRSSNCDYSPQVPRNLATSLAAKNCVLSLTTLVTWMKFPGLLTFH
jgi:hypothetical protein